MQSMPQQSEDPNVTIVGTGEKGDEMKYFTLMLKTWQGGHACGVSPPLPHTLRILGGAPLSLESGASLATGLRVAPLKLLVEVALGEIGPFQEVSM